MSTGWSLPAPEADLDGLFTAAFTLIHGTHFAGSPGVNPRLPVETRCHRRSPGWRGFFLLTPWMLAEVQVPHTAPDTEPPLGWSTQERIEAPFVMLGPAVTVTAAEESVQAHLGYLPETGHFLLRPLIQPLESYASTEAVYEAWHEVIASRRRVQKEWREATQGSPGAQRRLSRRELLGRLRG